MILSDCERIDAGGNFDDSRPEIGEPDGYWLVYAGERSIFIRRRSAAEPAQRAKFVPSQLEAENLVSQDWGVPVLSRGWDWDDGRPDGEIVDPPQFSAAAAATNLRYWEWVAASRKASG